MTAATTFMPVTAAMRQRIEAVVDHLLLLLDTIDGDNDLEPGGDDEPEPLEPYITDSHSDLEDDPAERGIADGGGLAEQCPTWAGYVE